MKKMMLLASVVGLVALLLAAAPAFSDHKCNPSPNNDSKDQKHENDDGDDDDGDDDNGNDIDSRLINRLNNVGNLEVSPTFEASQETEQDCDTGDVSQPISVDSTGDNSIQTVGVSPSANTGCSQTAVGVLDFDPTLGVQGGDFAFNADQFNVIQDNDCDGEDDGGDVDLDHIGSSITMDGGGDTVGGGTIDQAAAASSQQFVPWWWM